MSHFQQSVEVAAPIQHCFDQWMRFEEFPLFMDHVKSVTRQGNYFHWIVEGPLGSKVEWDAHMDGKMEDRLVSWHTLENATVDNKGSVTFVEVSPGLTQVTTTMEYNPPAGVLGEAVAKLFSDPEVMVKQDLEKFKTLMETRSMAAAQSAM